jgi:hypothetical protein
MTDDNIDKFFNDAGFAAWHAKIALTIAKSGHQLMGVFDHEGTMASFTYTIGLEKQLGFELIVFGLPYKYAGLLLNYIAAQVKAGEKLVLDVPDQRWAQIPLLFKKADERARGYVCQADRYYGHDVQTVQIVLPDKNARFPGDAEYDIEYMEPRQSLLYDPT